jgi:hypothetical protein
MQNKTTVTLMLCWMLALTGCTTTNEVLFVTKTSLGIDFDAKPATASIGYDRTEGYIAPRYENGEIPPVVASIKSDVAIFNPTIRQVYATGDAAVIAVSGAPEVVLNILDPVEANGIHKKKLQGEKKLMFFGTNTTTGLKVGFTSYLPDSFLFGFKRKEYSFIPLGTVGTGADAHDVYPSVLASIDTGANVSTTGVIENTSLSSSQFFATGRAARELAANDDVNKAFRDLATKSLRVEEAPYGADETSDRINAWLDKDEARTPPEPINRTKLKTWLKGQSSPTIRVSSLISENHRELREKAINDLAIPATP